MCRLSLSVYASIPHSLIYVKTTYPHTQLEMRILVLVLAHIGMTVFILEAHEFGKALIPFRLDGLIKKINRTRVDGASHTDMDQFLHLFARQWTRHGCISEHSLSVPLFLGATQPIVQTRQLLAHFVGNNHMTICLLKCLRVIYT